MAPRPMSLARLAALESLSVSIHLLIAAGLSELADDLVWLKHRATVEARQADDREDGRLTAAA